jgi:hypothetical protein
MDRATSLVPLGTEYDGYDPPPGAVGTYQTKAPA